MRTLSLRLRSFFSTSTTTSSQNVFTKYNQFRQVSRFESQNITWAVNQLQTHSNAIAKGLRTLGLTKGDTLLLRLPQELQTEIVATQLGAHKLGVNVQRSTATTDEEVVKQLERTNASGLIFDPAHLSQQFNTSLQLNKVHHGQSLSLSILPRLKFLIQTGSYSMRGVYKFKNILNYATDAYSPIKYQTLTPAEIPVGTEPIIVTDVYSISGLRGGLLNALYNNRFVIYAQPGGKGFEVLTGNIEKAYVIGEGVKELPKGYVKVEGNRLEERKVERKEEKVEKKEEKVDNVDKTEKKEEKKEEKKGEKERQNKPFKRPNKDASTQTKK